MATTASPSGAAPSQEPAAPDDERPETLDHRRDRRELERLLANAHRRLDERGVPR